jgi:hypothetical protein
MSQAQDIPAELTLIEEPTPMPLTWRVALVVLILCAYLGLAAGHIYSTPVAPSSEFNYINAPDEAAHLGYVRAIAYGHRLPIQNDTLFRTYEWHQPPLYYIVAAPFYGFGPIALRWLTTIIGFISLLLMFRASRILFPWAVFVPILTLGFAALVPMRQAIMSSVGNDSLTELMFVAGFLTIIRAMKRGLTLGRAAEIGVVLGAALLTKSSGLLLVPVIFISLTIMLRNGERVKDILRGGFCCFAIAATLSGAWFARNLHLYGEVLPTQVFMKEFEGTKKASDIIGDKATRLDYVRQVGQMAAMSFFAAYTPHPAAARNGSAIDSRQRRSLEMFARNGIPLFSEPGFYTVYWLYLAGGIVGLITLFPRRDTQLTSLQLQAVHLALFVILLVAASFAAFTWKFFQTQGRYLYPALLPISLCLSIGIRTLTPERYRTSLAVFTISLFCILSVAFLVTGIIPSYS